MEQTSGQFDFQTIVPRRGTRSLKWDIDSDPEVIELWVADMDFRMAPVIRKALESRIRHGILGYSVPGPSYEAAVVRWYEKRHGHRLPEGSVLPVTGVVPAVSAILQALCLPGDRVITHTPAYNCFFSSIRNAGAELAPCPLALSEGRWKADPELLERLASESRARVLLVCNPQNPTGRLWSREELLSMTETCRRHGLYVVSDEVHAEFTAPGKAFVPTASVSDWAASHVITVSSPAKSFNIAGLRAGWISAPEPEARGRIARQCGINEIEEPGIFGTDALLAAYSDEGAAWLGELNAVLNANRAFARSFLGSRIPEAVLPEQEGTYLLWADFSAFGSSSEEISRQLLERFKVRIAPGGIYGAPDGWLRINLAAPLPVIALGLERIAEWAESARKS